MVGGRRLAIRSRPASGYRSESYAVSCATPTACTAVGSYQLPYLIYAYAVRWNGRRWSEQPDRQADIQGSYVELTGVSCPTTATCIAVGNSGYQGNGFEWPFAERWTPAGWRPLKAASQCSLAERERG